MMSEVGHGDGRTGGGQTDAKSIDRDPVEKLAAEFASRFREGERVSIEEYASRYPDLAEAILDLFPTIVAMEQLNTKRLVDSGFHSPTTPEQLGDYRIIGEIARGGMGIVYEAEQVSLARRVAVKVLPPHALRRGKDVRRFEREAQTAASLHHSNIVPVFGVGETDGQRYIVMQLIRGVGLDEILREIKSVVVGKGRSEDATKVSTSRVSTAKRSAVGLLDTELKLSSTSVDADANTTEMSFTATTASAAEILPLNVRSPIGTDYFKNVARIGLQAAEALHYAHQNNTLHRDIKPGNLLLDEDGRIWIADFGLAKALQDDDVTCSGDVVGTMAYVAPERFRGETTKASDIYSLGVTLHEMLTLQKAFDGEDRVAVMNQVTNERLPSPRKINPAVPRDLETIVLKAASQDPNDRYESAAKLASDLEAFLEYRPIEARRLSHVEHAARWCRRNQGMTGLAVTVLVLLAAIFGLLVSGYHHAEKQRERAEVISSAAVRALDEIYNRFASTPLSAALGDEEVGDELESDLPQMPISKEVAALLEELLDFYDELSIQTEDSDTVTVKYIGANRRVGDINRRLGQLEEARLSYDAAADRIKQLRPALRDAITMRLETARVYNGKGLTFYRDWRHTRDRVDAHRKAVAILTIPNASDDVRFELATSLYLLHRAEQQRNWSRSRRRRDEDAASNAENHLDQAQAILSQLKKRKPARSDYDLLLARCLLAERKSRSSPDEPLSENQRQAISILEELVERFPAVPDYQFELGQVYQFIEWSRALNRRGKERGEEQLAEAARRLRKGLAATADLEIHHPNIPQYYLLKKHLHEYLGRVLRKQGKLSEAITQYERSIQMQRMLISSDENPSIHRRWLFALHIEYGKLLRDSDQLVQAKDVLMKTAHDLEAVIAQSRTDRSRHQSRRHSDNRRTLKSAYVALASVLGNLGDAVASREMLQKAEAFDDH